MDNCAGLSGSLYHLVLVSVKYIIARLTGTDSEPPVPLTPEEQAAIAASKAAAARGEFATDEQVRAVWAKHGL
jgi:hypothetical protein